MTTLDSLEIQTDIREEHGVQIREQLCPENWTEVDSYSACHTMPDYYGVRHQSEIARVLKAVGLTIVCLTTRRTQLNPMGSGPGGRVRLGDDMMNSTYRIAVPENEKEQAANAIEAHSNAVKAWIAGEAEMPAVLRS